MTELTGRNALLSGASRGIGIHIGRALVAHPADELESTARTVGMRHGRLPGLRHTA